jgi:four helix bundle protein
MKRNMKPEIKNQKNVVDLRVRSKAFALRIIKLYVVLPKTTEAQVLGKQMLRSATSVGAHLREGKRSRSRAELISKTEVALQELDETLYWLELLADSEIVKPERLAGLMQEVEELLAVLVSGVNTLKKQRNGQPMYQPCSY